jgi:hypothetical protein
LLPSVQSLLSLPFLKAWSHVSKPSAVLTNYREVLFEQKAANVAKGFWTPNGSPGGSSQPSVFAYFAPSVQGILSGPHPILDRGVANNIYKICSTIAYVFRKERKCEYKISTSKWVVQTCDWRGD